MPEYQQTKRAAESKSNIQTQTIPPKQFPTSHPMAIIQRARINPKSLTHADVMQLQRTIGNRAVGKLLTEIGLLPSKAKQAPPVQMQTIPEEEKEPLQGKMIGTIQLREAEEEEKLQIKPVVQRQEIPEEEEPLQGKMIESVQRQEIQEDEETCPSCMQKQEIPEEEEPLQGKFEIKSEQKTCPSRSTLPIQREKENRTGMPDNLKAGVESLSGIDMSDVRVHYNSDKPAEVGALAYTQGTNIHVAPGQEKHLPHEAWHVVQQAQGRVRTTMQLKNVAVNDDVELENEADLMGVKAMANTSKLHEVTAESELLQGQFVSLQHVGSEQGEIQTKKSLLVPIQSDRVNVHHRLKSYATQLKSLSIDKLNVVGEDHNESALRRINEENIAREDAKGGYWKEGEFRVGKDTRKLLARVFKKDIRKRGDSPILLAEFNAAAALTLSKIWLQKVKDYKLLSSGDKQELIDHMPPIYRYFEDVKIHNRRIINGQKKDDLLNCTNELFVMVKAIAEGKAESVSDKFETAINRVEAALNGRTRENIRKERSTYMHSSAIEASIQDQRGIWKVGEEHINDILRQYGDNEQYNLMTQNEFNTEYSEKLRRRIY